VDGNPLEAVFEFQESLQCPCVLQSVAVEDLEQLSMRWSAISISRDGPDFVVEEDRELSRFSFPSERSSLLQVAEQFHFQEERFDITIQLSFLHPRS
jgi:hypothetical protein